MPSNRPYDPTWKPTLQLDITEPEELDELRARYNDGDVTTRQLNKICVDAEPNEENSSLAICHILDAFEDLDVSPEVYLDLLEKIDPNTIAGSRVLVAFDEHGVLDRSSDTFDDLVKRIDLERAQKAFGNNGETARWNLQQIGLAPPRRSPGHGL